MSASKHTTIWCDWWGPHWSDRPGDWPSLAEGERCSEWVDHGMAYTAETRRSVRGEGWTYKGGMDLCPRHSLFSKDQRPPSTEARNER